MGSTYTSMEDVTGAQDIASIKWVKLQKLDPFVPLESWKETDYSKVKAAINEEYNYSVLTHEEKYSDGKKPNNIKFYVGQEEEQEFKDKKITNNTSELCLLTESNGFFASFSEAWARHGKVIISPDDVWLAIQIQFARYVDKNAEALRSTFVEHTGKEEIRIRMEDYYNTPREWPVFMERVVAKIRKKVKTNVDTDFLPKFSTTTPLMQNLKHLGLMDGMQNYFNYSSVCLCGIDSIGFLGTLEDWGLIRQTTLNLKKYHIKENSQYFSDFNAWVDKILFIIDQFIIAYNGTVIIDFWNGVIHQNRIPTSGPPIIYMRGWLNAFLTGKYEEELCISSISSGRLQIPVKLEHWGKISHVGVIGGFTGMFFDKKELSFRPQSSLAVISVKNSLETMRNKNFKRI